MANLKCVDVQALTVPLKHGLSNTLNFWLSQFVCEGAEQNGEWRALSVQFTLFVDLCD